MQSYSLLACDINQAGPMRSQDGHVAIFPTNGATNVTLQASKRAGQTWTAAVIRLYRANAPQGPYVNFISATSLSSEGITAEVDCSGVAWVVAYLDTLEGTSQLVDLTVFLNDRNA